MYPRCCRINLGFYSSTLVDKEPKDSHKEKRQHQGYYMYPRCCRINFGFYSSTLVDKEPKKSPYIINIR